MIILDASVILRHLLQDHECLSARADEFMRRVKAGEVEVLILDVVFAECIFVLTRAYKVPREIIGDLMAKLLGYAGVMGENLTTLQFALTLYRNSNVSFVDSLIVAAAWSRRCEFLSFDKQLNRLGPSSRETR